MRESLTDKSPGDRLYAAEVNELMSVCRRFGLFRPGSEIDGVHTKTIVSGAGTSEWTQFTVQISGVKPDLGEGSPTIHLCRVVYYNFSSSTWTVATEERSLDANGTGLEGGPGLETGQRLTAWWDAQRGMFVPVIPGDLYRRFQLKEVLEPGTGTADAYLVDKDGDVDTSVEFEAVDPLHQLRGAIGAEGYARYYPGVGWLIVRLVPCACMIRGQTASPVSSSDTAFNLGYDTIVVLFPDAGLLVPPDPDNPTGPVPVNNVHHDAFDTGANVVAVWNQETAEWDCLEGDCLT